MKAKAERDSLPFLQICTKEVSKVTRYICDELRVQLSMFLSSCLIKRRCFLKRSFHLGNSFLNPSSDDIVFRAICVNLKHRRWNFLEQNLLTLTSPLVSRVVCAFQKSPQLALEFYNWVREKKSALHSLDSSSCVIHVLVNSRRYDDALCLMGSLMTVNGLSPMEVLEALNNSYRMCESSPAVFDALIRACTQIGATEGAYEVIKKLQVEDCWVTIHAWNNFLSHLLKFNEIGRFWMVYKEMISYGYMENIYTFNLVAHALCKDYKLQEAMSLLYRILKSGTWPNVVTFNMIVDGACKMGDMDLALKFFRKVEIMSAGSIKPNLVTYNSLINGFCKIGRITWAEELRNEMMKTDIKPNVRTYATMIEGYSRAGSLEEALRLCDEMVERGLLPNSVVYNSIMHWLYMEGDVGGASLVFADMTDKQITLDKFTYSVLAKGLCRNGYITKALKLHNQVLENNLIEDAFSHNILINFLCKSNNITGVRQLLASMFVRGLVPDVVTFGIVASSVTYNMLINFLCKLGHIQKAKELMKMMVLRGVLPDNITYTTLVTNASKNCGPEEVVELHDYMVLKGVVPDKLTYDDRVRATKVYKEDCCQKWRDKVGVRQLVASMFVRRLVPDVVTFDTLVDGLCKEVNIESAVQDDLVDFARTLADALQETKLDEAFTFSAEMENAGILASSVTDNTLIDFFCLSLPMPTRTAALKKQLKCMAAGCLRE
ncbi:unnamed protein product [Dovyalis caffra]|uniref:Pentatricopeptide repeat-containing protein n=1 Tax=Dovyalis caffra TaxID=77055 RepID=A0AAV1SK18_9ROSI|nr:unnamed protein product [Dovyalis caffra]